jgi:2-keto-3-deoxy-L-fuconate dehydrogenase
VVGKLTGMTALVTSAGQGIGLASALALAALAKAHPQVSTFSLNVMDQAAVDGALAHTGPIDILFNCSGFVHHGTVLDCAEKDWDFSFDLNVKAHYRMIKAYLPGMLARGKGNIINMASVASSIKGAPNRFVYGASKAAVIGMTKALAADFVAKGIRCNAICPGTVETPSLYDRMRAQGDFDKAKAAFIARQPMGRLAQPEEIGKMVVYLASDDSSFMTGQALIIDGGWSL